MFRALQIEMHYSKDEILQLYLNLVPYGSNIEGVKSASLIYFGQTPDYLSLAQIVTLAIVPNRPSSLVLGNKNDLIVIERNKWLKNFAAEKLFPEEEINDALTEKLAAQRQAVPHLAPHISIRLARANPAQAIIHSTINIKMQEKAENLAFNYIKRIHSKNITNCAVMVLNNETGKVEAYLGSADFNNAEDHGQVDGVRAIRSPGSTLKPYLYALAFDKGIATPKSVITDVPVNFSGYMPENFDKKFRGTITVENALANSLNVPAVKILDEIGVQQFVASLKSAGFSSVQKNENQLGLSVILGGCGVKLEELVRLYSCFANDGKEKKISFLEDNHQQKNDSGVSLLSPAASFITSNILTQHMRPDLPNNFESSTRLPKIAWKTGTSYGRRDAWSIGFNKEYTVGIWIGNFDGTGVPELTGADIATPLLFEIFNTITYNNQTEWLQQPKDCDFRLVCSVSGKVPEDFCNDQLIDYYIPGISSSAKCDHLKDVFVSADSSMSYCRNCLPHSGFKKKLYSNLPPELISFYETENIPYQKIPEHNPDCTRIYTANAPVITSPSDGLEYIFEKNSGTQLMLTCNADNEVKQVFWYINDQFFRAAAVTEKVFFTPNAGEVKISCADDKGRNTNVKVKVTILK
jgi:penicillin-binding protein 1C